VKWIVFFFNCCLNVHAQTVVHLFRQGPNDTTRPHNIIEGWFTSGSRGAHPLTAADLWFLYAQNGNFSQVFLRLLRSRLIVSIILIEIRLKHPKKDFSFNLQQNSVWKKFWSLKIKINLNESKETWFYVLLWKKLQLCLNAAVELYTTL